MKAGFFLALFAALQLNCLGDDTNQLFFGGWSQNVNGLRSRFVVSIEHENERRCAAVYLELQNVSDAAPIEFNSGFSLKCQLTNTTGTAFPSSVCNVDHFIPRPYWIDIPYGSTLKLRVDDAWATVAGFKGQTGVSMVVGSGFWLIPDKTTNEYFLTGVFQVQPAFGTMDHEHPWNGTIQPPQVKIYFHK